MKNQNENIFSRAIKEKTNIVEPGREHSKLINVPPDSIDEHTRIEEANAVIAQKEIGQQNENS